ncbi:hypothetical protein skT53_30280 [Effusibacillus dendaii]|uniref:Uncharacterized protein n=1 Tax=Effusibacillus dendaii TaxID=2743772 RepID=A0A7I8DCW2_9BACL|nr:hypothetical protein skT53_30280 [Effusibacillus dendaii]
MVKAAPLIFLILFTSGALAVIEKTGAIDAFLKTTLHKFRNRLLLFIIPIALVFSVLGTTGIVVNSVIALIPLGIILARGLKLDAVFGAALIYLGTYTGWNMPVIAPQTLGLSQRIAELPLFSGIGYRIVMYLTVLIVTIAYIYWYARKIKKDPGKSILGSDPFPNSVNENQTEADHAASMTLRQKRILAFPVSLYWHLSYSRRSTNGQKTKWQDCLFLSQ